METVEVKVLKYAFRFKTLHWRDEMSIKPVEKLDRRRQILSHALVEVSGFPIVSVEDGLKLFKAIPITIISRIFVIYKGTIPADRIFSTMGLYKAPEPMRYAGQIEQAEREREEDTFQRVETMMENKFGREEMQAARELQAVVAKKTKLRGAQPATPDRSTVEDENAVN